MSIITSIVSSIRELITPEPPKPVDIGRAPQFDDPRAVEPELLRCFYCGYLHIFHKETTHDEGCIECGSRRMKNAGAITDDEMRDLIARGFDDSAYHWEPDDVRLKRIQNKREIDRKFQVRKAVVKEREDNLRKRDRLAGRGPNVLLG